MRTRDAGLLLLMVLAAAGPALAQDAVFANGFEPRRFCDLAAGPASCPGFTIAVPDVTVAPGEETVRSFYFRTPNTAVLAVRRLAAVRSGLVLELRWNQTLVGNMAQECRPPGSLDSTACCAGTAGGLAVPMFTARRPFDDQFFSATDGSGVAIALEVPPNAPACLEMHLFNDSASPATERVTVSAEAQLPAVPYVATAPFLAVTSQISVPPLSNGTTVIHNCPTRANTRFWQLSTRTFRQGVDARLSRGPEVLLVNTDWAAPREAIFGPPDFVSFDATNRLSTSCTYVNPTPRTITAGQSPLTDETCEATGYFFPATTPSVCFNGFLVL